MSITTTKDVFCDRCSCWVTGGTEITNAEARKAAKKQRWKQIKDKDICPTCWEIMQ
jgi:hypothetical protein